MGEVCSGYDIVRPVSALVLVKDPSDHSLGGHVPEPVGVRIHKFSHKVWYGQDTHKIVKGFHWSCLKDPGDLTYPLILCHLHLVYEAHLADPGVPDLCAIGKRGDD